MSWKTIDHCRIGSLEMDHEARVGSVNRSLPHRQLRKVSGSVNVRDVRSLPHRQLRKQAAPQSNGSVEITAA